MKHFITSQKHIGKRLDTVLAKASEKKTLFEKPLSRSRIARGIKKGGILCNGKPTKPNYVVRGKEVFEIFPDQFREESEILLPEPNISIPVIAENDQFLVIDKPAGIQTHPSANKVAGTVVNWLFAKYPNIKKIGDDPTRPGIVHRLDRDTSGLLVIAKTQHSFSALKKAFKARAIRKRYLALVFGVPKEKEGIIKAPIARSSRGDRQAVRQKGRRTKGVSRPAETQYRVLESFENAALLELEPKTGRTHQIRVHLASIGHPVLGDTLYASKASKLFEKSATRHLLHARSLSFRLFGEEYSFESPLPEDFREILEGFTKEKKKNILSS